MAGLFGLKYQPNEVWVSTGNGYGSTGTNTRCFLNVIKNTGTAITYIADTVFGDRFIINEPGVYAITYCDASSGVSINFGITADSQVLNSTSSQYYISGQGVGTASAPYACVPGIGYFYSGQVLRAQEQQSNSGSNALTFVHFRICKVSSGT